MRRQSRQNAELAAKDRLSFHQITTCPFSRGAMLEKGLKGNINKDTIISKVFKFHDEVKSVVEVHLQEGFKNKRRYSLSVDEYTCRNRHS